MRSRRKLIVLLATILAWSASAAAGLSLQGGGIGPPPAGSIGRPYQAPRAAVSDKPPREKPKAAGAFVPL
jgi:hypothetical protein